MKIWVFVEGDSEELMLLCLTRKYGFSLEKDKTVFIEKNAHEANLIFYIHNSSSVDKIHYDIIDYYHQIVRADCEILVICDVERRLNCPSERKKIIYSHLQKEHLYFQKELTIICSVPMIEQIYCDEKNYAIATVKKIHKNKFGKDIKEQDIRSSILDEAGSPKERIKKLMKSVSLIFRGPEFSENFFSRIDWQNSQNQTIQRLNNFILRKCDELNASEKSQ